MILGSERVKKRIRNEHLYRPWQIRLTNFLGSAIAAAGVPDLRLDVNSLLATASRKTGLDDFGQDDFREPLAVLVKSYEAEAALNFIGKLATRTYLLRLLENRLLLERDRARHPEIAAQQVQSPVFIIGLPRTGSTLLFELMAMNPVLRAPMSWEVMLPSPPPRAETFGRDPRIDKAQRLLSWLDRIAPEFKRIHPIGATLPQECIPIQAQAFRSIQLHTANHAPSYQSWLERADLTPAYEYHRRMLQHFQAFGPKGTWLLKAPGHLFGLDTLFRVYPDARIVQTHRDPLKIVGSIASHCACLRQAFSERVDLGVIGSTWARLWSVGLSRTLKFRRDHPKLGDRFHDLHYADLVRNPIAAAEAIHRRFDLPLSQHARQRMQAYLASHPKGLNGVHHYELSDYGLDADREWHRFSGYSSAFGIERSAAA